MPEQGPADLVGACAVVGVQRRDHRAVVAQAAQLHVDHPIGVDRRVPKGRPLRRSSRDMLHGSWSGGGGRAASGCTGWPATARKRGESGRWWWLWRGRWKNEPGAHRSSPPVRAGEGEVARGLATIALGGVTAGGNLMVRGKAVEAAASKLRFEELPGARGSNSGGWRMAMHRGFLHWRGTKAVLDVGLAGADAVMNAGIAVLNAGIGALRRDDDG